MAELQMCTRMGEHAKEISSLSDKLEKSRKELHDLQNQGNYYQEMLDAKLMCEELRKDVERRNEQIEFLMQVHDASKDYEWVQKWACKSCTLLNPGSVKKCEMCGADKEPAQGGGIGEP